MFIELKRRGKDRISSAQVDFLLRAIQNGLELKNFAIFEWYLS